MRNLIAKFKSFFKTRKIHSFYVDFYVAGVLVSSALVEAYSFNDAMDKATDFLIDNFDSACFDGIEPTKVAIELAQ